MFLSRSLVLLDRQQNNFSKRISYEGNSLISLFLQTQEHKRVAQNKLCEDVLPSYNISWKMPIPLDVNDDPADTATNNDDLLMI